MQVPTSYVAGIHQGYSIHHMQEVALGALHVRHGTVVFVRFAESKCYKHADSE